MSEQEVINLMKSSKSEQEWNDNCNKVIKACDGYPPFWYSAIVTSGLADEVSSQWGGDGDIHIIPLGQLS